MVEFISEICRTCLEDTKLLQSLYNVEQFAEKTSKLADFLKELTGIDFSKEDGLPSSMCQECIQKMSIAIQFKEMCLTSNDILRGNNREVKIEANNEEPMDESLAETSCDTKNMTDENQPKRRSRKQNLADLSEVIFPYSDCIEVYDASEELSGRTKGDNTKRGRGRPRKNEAVDKDKPRKSPKKEINDPDNPRLICKMCGKDFKHDTTLKNHLARHTGDTPFTCAHCEKQFKTKTALKDHIVRHRSDRPFKCKICGQAYAYKAAFKIHMLKHKGKKPFQCTICGERFAERGDLKSHSEICNKSLTTRGNLKLECNECGKKFHSKRMLQDHAITHTKLGSFTCKFCNKTFNKHLILKRHMLNSHT